MFPSKTLNKPFLCLPVKELSLESELSLICAALFYNFTFLSYLNEAIPINGSHSKRMGLTFVHPERGEREGIIRLLYIYIFPPLNKNNFLALSLILKIFH